MSISPQFMQELRDRLSLSDIIGRRVKLARAGHEYRACCPFHGEKSPSFYVNDDKQFFHCFGCGAHGDAIGFVMRHDNLSFIEAVESLASEAGMQVPKQSREDVERAKQEKDLYGLMDAVTAWFQEKLHSPAHRDALDYALGRGLGEDVLSAFRVGFAPADGDALPAYLRAQGYTDAQMIACGVAKKSERRPGVYAFFRDRLIFPVPDRRGRVVAFGARVLPEHLRPIDPAKGKPPKYINSTNTDIFDKGRMLFGEPHARQAGGEGKRIIVVEGYLDVIACWRAGFTGALAPMGTALTEDQIAALWKMIPHPPKIPVLCFDGDNAGRRAAVRACERILPHLKPDHSAVFAFLPEGQDPDSLIQTNGVAAFQSVIDAAMPLADFLWTHHTEGRTFATPEEKAGLSRTLEDEAARILDRDVQHFYRDTFRRKIRETFGSPFAQGARAAGGARGPARNGRNASGGSAGGRVTPPPPLVRPTGSDSANQRAQLTLLLILLNHPWVFDQNEYALSATALSDPRLDSLRQAAVQALSSIAGLDAAGLYDHLMQAGYGKELQNLASGSMYVHAGFARPDAEEASVREGWAETIRFLHSKAGLRDLRQAADALAGDFSEENEQRLLALQRARREGDGSG